MKTGFKLLILIILAGSSVLFGQSIYSQYGIGQLAGTNSVRNAAAAGTGIAVMESDGINSSNFAALSTIDVTRFELSGTVNAMFLKSDGAKKYYSRMDFSGFSLAFPLYKPYGLAFAAGLVPFSTINYDSKKTLEHSALGKYTQQFTGSGGLNKMYFALAYRFPFDLRFSTTYNYMFGRSEYNSIIKFENSDFSKSDYASQYDVTGSGLSFGLISPEMKSLLSSDLITGLRLGFNIDLFTDLNTEAYNLATSAYISETVKSTTGTTQIPPKISFGVSGILKNTMAVNLDYSSQAWSSFKRLGNQDLYMRNSSRVGLGLVYRAPRTAGYDSERWIYRAGVSYEQTPIVIAGNNINQLNLSAGMSVPLNRSNFIETALTYSMRGKTGNGLIKENLLKLDLSLNFGEIWFVQQER